jgi:hypothetical protein
VTTQQLQEPDHRYSVIKCQDGRVELIVWDGHGFTRIYLVPSEASFMGYQLEHKAHWE